MKRMIKRAVCLILALALSGIPIAFAAVESNAYISSYGAAITRNGNGSITVNFNTHGTGSMDSIGATAISIYENGHHKTTFYAANSDYTSLMLGSGYYFYGGVPYQGVAGRTYKALITHYAEKDGGSGTENLWTASVVAT